MVGTHFYGIILAFVSFSQGLVHFFEFIYLAQDIGILSF
jgi:hypothetical protein